MFKAINQNTDEAIIILDDHWQNNLESLRALSAQNILVCQECRQPLVAKMGDIRLWHFAHKHRQNCPYNTESPVLLKTRAVLYRWLVVKFNTHPGTSVTLEKPLEGLPRHIDCWVDLGNDKSIAYWILEGGIAPQKRGELQDALTRSDTVLNWVFASVMLRKSEDDSRCLHLTTTERQFASHSKYDKPFAESGKTLHYLDSDTEEMTTYRGLLPTYHSGQEHTGHLKTTPLSQLLTDPATWEFAHPGEYQDYQQWEYKKQEELRLAQQKQTHQPPAPPIPQSSSRHRFSWGTENSAPQPSPYEQAAVCIHCGETTTDWWTYDGAKGTCRCRKCRDEGKY